MSARRSFGEGEIGVAVFGYSALVEARRFDDYLPRSIEASNPVALLARFFRVKGCKLVGVRKGIKPPWIDRRARSIKSGLGFVGLCPTPRKGACSLDPPLRAKLVATSALVGARRDDDHPLALDLGWGTLRYLPSASAFRRKLSLYHESRPLILVLQARQRQPMPLRSIARAAKQDAIVNVIQTAVRSGSDVVKLKITYIVKLPGTTLTPDPVSLEQNLHHRCTTHARALVVQPASTSTAKTAPTLASHLYAAARPRYKSAPH